MEGNIPGFPSQTNEPTEEVNWFGERYKVLSWGIILLLHHNFQMMIYMAVMYLSASGGGRGSSRSANLTQGCFVFGFFLDGDNAQQPVIMGCMGYSDYQEIKRNIPEQIFTI